MHYLWYTLEFEGDVLVEQFDEKPSAEQLVEALKGYTITDQIVHGLLEYGEATVSYYADMKLDTEGPEECE